VFTSNACVNRVKTRKIAGMELRQTNLSPLLRSFAALTLLGFIAAQALCFIHCNFGGGHGDSTPPSCHAAAPPPASHDEGSSPSQPDTSPTTVCSTLKNQLTSSGSPALVVPEFCVLYLLTPLTLALDATATGPEASCFRQANHGDWVFTPEVSLGPAFRSLAPPFIG
jgi:hypothetical protein